jgi:hypothetical protein
VALELAAAWGFCHVGTLVASLLGRRGCCRHPETAVLEPGNRALGSSSLATATVRSPRWDTGSTWPPQRSDRVGPFGAEGEGGPVKG